MLKVDAAQLADLAKVQREAGKHAPKVIARGLNHSGDRGWTAVRKTLAKQMGVKNKTITEGLTRRKATPARLEYVISGRGGFLPLRDFGARQTAQGISAAPWGKRRVFKSTFIVPKIGGHGFRRSGKTRLPIVKLWGPSIPGEMVKDATLDAWKTTVVDRIGDRIAHELARLVASGKGAGS